MKNCGLKDNQTELGTKAWEGGQREGWQKFCPVKSCKLAPAIEREKVKAPLCPYCGDTCKVFYLQDSVEGTWRSFWRCSCDEAKEIETLCNEGVSNE